VTSSARVLAISDDFAVRSLTANCLEAKGHKVLCVSDSHKAIQALDGDVEFDCILLDGSHGKDLDELFSPVGLRKFENKRLCILSAPGDTRWTEDASRWGVTNVLYKPWLGGDLERFVAESLLPGPRWPVCRTSHSPIRSASSSFHLEDLDDNGFFLAACPSMLQMYKNIRTLAPVDHPVLILGETGSGKEVVARLLHKYHDRAGKKFINVNSAAIPSELLESELFGYEAGAFTGALKSKPGKFEMADKGTLLLDEIGEMSPQMQAKLLHVLQDGSFTRLGGRASSKADVRILAATNVNIEDAIAEKRFREDLYYRLSAFTITVPSLRERCEEIPLLMEQMLLRGAASAGQNPVPFSLRVMEAAQEYHWPGNLRELRNFVTRFLVLQDDDSAYEDLGRKTRKKPTVSAPPPTTSDKSMDVPSSGHLDMKGVVSNMKLQAESRMIKEALTASGWNQRRAANNLKISYRALLYKIQQHGLSA